MIYGIALVLAQAVPEVGDRQAIGDPGAAAQHFGLETFASPAAKPGSQRRFETLLGAMGYRRWQVAVGQTSKQVFAARPG